MHTRPILTVNLKTLCENYLFLKQYVQPVIPACVLKNNAYGLGADIIGKTLYDNGVKHFFVAHGCEGALLKTFTPNAKIFILQGYDQEEKELFEQNNLIPVLPTLKAVKNWFNNPANTQHPALQVETGLNRLGVCLNEIPDLQNYPFSLILSHLACADESNHYLNERQKENFKQFKNFFPNIPFTLSASDGVFLGKSFHFDMVRLGAALYGINTTPYTEKKVQNVIKVKAPILQIKTVQGGETIGYSATYTVKRPTKVATVSIGYADGIFRSFQEKGKLHLQTNEKIYTAPIIGRVSMDNIMCDVSDIPEQILVQITYMTIIDDFYDLDAFGKDCNTIGYEVLNNIGHATRYIRNYIFE